LEFALRNKRVEFPSDKVKRLCIDGLANAGRYSHRFLTRVGVARSLRHIFLCEENKPSFSNNIIMALTSLEDLHDAEVVLRHHGIQPRCSDIGVLRESLCSKGIEIIETNMLSLCKKSGNAQRRDAGRSGTSSRRGALLGSAPLHRGDHFWEIQVETLVRGVGHLMIGVANAPQVHGLEPNHTESDFSSIDLESPGRNGATLHCFTSQRTACRVGRDINNASAGMTERVFGTFLNSGDRVGVRLSIGTDGLAEMFLWYNDRSLGRVFTGIETPVWPIVIMSRNQTRNRSFITMMRGNLGSQSQFVANPVRVRVLSTFVSSSPSIVSNYFENVVERTNEMRQILGHRVVQQGDNESEEKMKQEKERWRLWRQNQIVTRRVQNIFVNARNDFAAWIFVMCSGYVFQTPYGMAIWFSKSKSLFNPSSSLLRLPCDAFERRDNENRRPSRRRRRSSWPSFDSLCRVHLLDFESTIQVPWRDVRKWLDRRDYEVLPRSVELSLKQRERASEVVSKKIWSKDTKAELKMKDSTIMSVRCLGVLQDGRVLVSSLLTSRVMICDATSLSCCSYDDDDDDDVITSPLSYQDLVREALQRDVKDWYFIHEIATDVASSLSISLYELSCSDLFSNRRVRDSSEREMYGVMFTKLRDISETLKMVLGRLPYDENSFWFASVRD